MQPTNMEAPKDDPTKAPKKSTDWSTILTILSLAAPVAGFLIFVIYALVTDETKTQDTRVRRI